MKNSYYKKFKQSGFSLLEVIIASLLAFVIGILLLSILSSHTGFFYKQNSIINEGLDLNDAIAEIDSYIRESFLVSASYPEGVSPVYSTDGDTLVLKLAVVSGNDVLTGVFDYVIIEKDSSNPGVLKLQIIPNIQSSRKAVNKVLTTNLESILYTYRDNNGGVVTPASASVVEVDLTIKAKVGQVESVRTANSKTTLRNK